MVRQLPRKCLRLAITIKSLVNETGTLKWVRSFGVGNYALTLSMKRLTKDEEYSGSRFLVAETQAGWDSISNDPKTHSFYGNYLCCWIFVCKIDFMRYFNSLLKTVSPLMIWSQIIYGHRTASISQNRTILRSRTAPGRRQEDSYDFLSIVYGAR